MKPSALRARPLSSDGKMRGAIGEKCRFSKKKIEFGFPFYMKLSALRARSLSSHRNMTGDDLAKIGEEDMEDMECGLPFYTTCTHSGGDVDENCCFT